MINLTGITPLGGASEAPKPSGNRGTSSTDRAANDEVAISATGASLSEINGLAEKLSGSEEIREERVAEARRNIEEGVYRVQEIVEQVASRLTRFVE